MWHASQLRHFVLALWSLCSISCTLIHRQIAIGEKAMETCLSRPNLTMVEQFLTASDANVKNFRFDLVDKQLHVLIVRHHCNRFVWLVTWNYSCWNNLVCVMRVLHAYVCCLDTNRVFARLDTPNFFWKVCKMAHFKPRCSQRTQHSR